MSNKSIQVLNALRNLDHETLFTHNPTPMWVYDIDTLKFLAVNTSAIRSYGYSEDEFLSMDLKDIRPAEDIPLLQADLLINDQDLQRSAYWRHRKKDGSIIFVDIHSNLLPSLEKLRTRLVMAIDVTDRKLANDKLIESERKFRTLADSTVAAIFIYKIPNFIYVNKSAELLTGFSNEEFMKMNFWDIVYPDDREVVKSRGIARLKGKKTPSHYEFRVLTKSGDMKYVDFTAAITSVNNENVGIGTAYDITERKLTELEIIKAKENAEEMNRLKSNFLSNMSHELRTPLTGILGFSEILKEDLSDPDRATMVDFIYESGQRLLHTLNSILDLSNIEANKINVETLEFDLAKLLSDEVKSHLLQASTKNIDLILNLPDENLIVDSDERIIKKVVSNLINNAIKFTHQGSVTVSCYFALETSGKVLHISVKDTGIGIPQENQQYIFDEFRQGSEGLNRRFEGSGLGLSLANKFIEMIDGEVSFKSEVGNGSEFLIKIPLPEKSEVEANLDSISNDKQISDLTDDEPQQTEPESIKFKLLFVEDEKTNSEVVQRMLPEIYQLDTAADAEIAVRLATDNNYDLFLMDIHLGSGPDGFILTKMLKRMAKYSETPFIAVTAFGSERERNKYLESGFDDLILKPFTKTELLTKIAALLP